jgi:superfamily II RNA helicase
MEFTNKINLKYELDSFQQEACNYIANNYNVLVSAPTGSGKTLIAEYGIEYSKNLNKIEKEEENFNYKIIYTCPIKSLCNEKFRDMTLNYKDTDNIIGLMTGDIIINPNGNIIIMTTEVLYNLMVNDNPEFKNIICVIYDEVHYINDEGRGHVWEKCIIYSLIKYNCLLVLLSATIGNIDELLNWLNSINIHKQFQKIIKLDRPVPLIEYVVDNTKCRNLTKKSKAIIDDKDNEERNKDNHINDEYIPKPDNSDPDPESYDLLELSDVNYNRVKRYWTKLGDFNYSMKFELETLCNQIASNPKLGIPAIIFVLSKSRCIEYAEMLTSSYVDHEEQSKILHFYDYNLKEFNTCSQYINLRQVISKGIAYHHSGLIPKIREVVEFLIKDKLIKIVFATETFAVGLNFPVKTVVLTSLTKPTDKGRRNLNVSEYKQMAGRAGRRYLDKVGNVIIWLLNTNSSRASIYPDWMEVRNITNGAMDNVESKYVIEPNYILKNISDGSYQETSKHSFKYYKTNIVRNDFYVDPKYKKLFEIELVVIEYGKQGINYVDKNYRKLVQKLNKDEQTEYKKILEDYHKRSVKTEFELYIDLENMIIEFLHENDFIKKDLEKEGNYLLTDKGDLAQIFNEINPVLFIDNMDYILSNKKNILPILSMFIDDGVKLEDDLSVFDDNVVYYFKKVIDSKYYKYMNIYPKWVFHPLNYKIIESWLSSPELTLDDISNLYEVDMGLVVKILIKMYQITDELVSKLIKINRIDLTEYLLEQKDLLIRYPLKIDSLYIT